MGAPHKYRGKSKKHSKMTGILWCLTFFILLFRTLSDLPFVTSHWSRTNTKFSWKLTRDRMAHWLRAQASKCESQLHHVLTVWPEQVTQLLCACFLTRKRGQPLWPTHRLRFIYSHLNTYSRPNMAQYETWHSMKKPKTKVSTFRKILQRKTDKEHTHGLK